MLVLKGIFRALLKIKTKLFGRVSHRFLDPFSRFSNPFSYPFKSFFGGNVVLQTCRPKKLLLSVGNKWSRSYREINRHPSLPWNFITHGFLDPSAFPDSFLRFLGGHFGPEKKCLPPPPKKNSPIRRRDPPGPSAPPLPGDPPPWEFL